MLENKLISNIKQQIQIKGIKQFELAKAIGIEPTKLSAILKSRRKITGIELIKISNALDIKVEDLVK
ncbi:MAG: helix-turn-helix transcriptional regulator [Anaerovoracaceae bacterium]